MTEYFSVLTGKGLELKLQKSGQIVFKVGDVNLIAPGLWVSKGTCFGSSVGAILQNDLILFLLKGVGENRDATSSSVVGEGDGDHFP